MNEKNTIYDCNLCFCHILILVTFFLPIVLFGIQDGYVTGTMLHVEVEGTRKECEILSVLEESFPEAFYYFRPLSSFIWTS